MASSPGLKTLVDGKPVTTRQRLLPCAILGVALLSAAARGAVTLPRLIGDHMVLQRDQPVKIWGWDRADQRVTVTLGAVRVTGTTDRRGQWSVTLPAHPAGGPFALSIEGSSHVVLRDILFGEVWVCSGQSNMDWPLKRCVPHLRVEIPGAELPKFRLIRLPQIMAAQPLGDDRNAVGLSEFGKQREIRKVPLMPRPVDRAATVEAEGAGWQVCTAASARHYSGVAYFFGRELYRELGVPIGLVHASWGGSKIEPWIPPAGYGSVPALRGWSDQIAERVSGRFDYTAPTVIFNGMIHPLLPCAIRGAIWYQGESNGNEGESYLHKMRALVNGWRRAWDQGDFPFYFVQLPNYVQHGRSGIGPDNDPQGGTGWARIREAQGQVAGQVVKTGMAVTIDVGEAGNIHPSNKYDVGRRLALMALANDYGRKTLVASGPVYRSMQTSGDRITLRFAHLGGGLMAARKSTGQSREAAEPIDHLDGLPLAGADPGLPQPTDRLEGFATAGADRQWRWAEAVIESGQVVVSSPQVERPVAVRYGFSANPGRINLYNREGLPAVPFRTDDWKFLRYHDHTLSRIVDPN